VGDDPSFCQYVKESQIISSGQYAASPATTWLLLDEHPDSINDGWFAVGMQGFQSDPSSYILRDCPASYHGNAGDFSYVDGHAEIHKWQDPRTMPPVTIGSSSYVEGQPSPNNLDVQWMQSRTTVPLPGQTGPF
jgi:prepilin-type processing-associated H-X9-DG protein